MGERFPLAPLLEAMGIVEIHDGEEGGQQPDQPLAGLARLAAQLEISHRTAQRFHQFGLNERQADAAAVRIGQHPQIVWPEYRDGAPGEEDLVGKRCRCRPGERRPIGGICDRCGRSLVQMEAGVSDAA